MQSLNWIQPGHFPLRTGSFPEFPRIFTLAHAPDSRLRSSSAAAATSSAMEAGGIDSAGREFKNAAEMWREELGEGGDDGTKKAQWYSQGVGYWQGVEASVDGVLGGYGHVNEADIKCSEPFLKALLAERFSGANKDRHLVALDCGSGVGRITKNLLIRYFNEEFTPEAGRYDVIWIQWCIGHLADDDFISFFKRAKIGLKPGGFFVLKENIARNGFVLDKEDRSVTRSDLYFKELFNQCGLHLYKSKDQRGFPEELFAVKMYALSPDAPKRGHRPRSKGRANRPGTIR